MNYQNITTEMADGIGQITINRPSKLNALNVATIEELHLAFQTMASDPSIGAILLTGAGEKAFVAGADIAEFAHFSVEQGTLLAAEGQKKLFDLIENLSKPVIAAINGFALGGGLELAMACHFRIASSNAKMGLPEVSLGVIPGYGGTQRLPQLIGKGRAMEMIMTASMIDAATALSYGLVNHVVEQTELINYSKSIIYKILKNAPTAITQAILAINAPFKVGVNGYQTEIVSFGNCFGTADFKEGTTAFLEKRKAHFTGN
ncbi:enoyl-CoA hydratase [Flavobacterium branchiophilum]|uniref:Enoyl-CoA hydratase n=1 Tax=Flavobacterium branchiophilum TaxID=55197 RepID=A0A543G4Z9_9FLAO|nr:enoyl-CoA hydratase-related protein [Flavobacterium branchiophilum]OXA78377.1 enoyl-CoA hydratase [Flavobacterium branchiophilum] [Flavobacterium branchiophilum NBRC 15030 = ATCC 35035]TQM41149.1 enoyl-CoA hydratase [Flavobacterium branchiophilum]GEM56244.1 enoyl-CoA hydratase [Flavobacterium branchiophilum NBRC 15030 = ATCC 35035]